MSTISVPAFTRKLREVVADEPKAFAYDLGLSLSAVYNYLNGRVPATEVLFRIARYTGRPMEWFLVDEQAAAAVTAGSGEIAVPASYAASRRRGEGTRTGGAPGRPRRATTSRARRAPFRLLMVGCTAA